MSRPPHIFFFFFFNDTATTEIYTLSLHDALPISMSTPRIAECNCGLGFEIQGSDGVAFRRIVAEQKRSEEHTSELQSQSNLVCRLLLEKKKNTYHNCLLDPAVRECLTCFTLHGCV